MKRPFLRFWIPQFVLFCMSFLVLMVASCSKDADKSEDYFKHFKSATVAFSKGEFQESVREGLSALEGAQTKNDIVMGGNSHQLLADCYREVYNLRAARRHRRMALDAFREAGKTENAFYAAMDLAGEYALEDNDSSYFLMEEARRLIDSSNPAMQNQFDFIYADICRAHGDYDKALSHLREVDTGWLGKVMTPADSIRAGEILWHTGNGAKALEFFNTPDAGMESIYWECMAEHEEKAGNLREALEYRRHMENLQNAEAGRSLSNALESVERGFYETRMIEERDKRLRLIFWFATGGGLILLTVLGWILWRLYSKSRSLKADNYMKDVVLLSVGDMDEQPAAEEAAPADTADIPGPVKRDETPEAQPTETDTDTEKWINVILDFYMARLNDISREYFKVSDENQLKEIRKEFNRELKSVRDGDLFSEMERRLNERDDDVVKAIRKGFPKFNEQYIRLMICALAGLSSQSACLLLSIEKGNYYVMWTRIRQRIRAYEGSGRERFLALFCKKD